MNEYWIFKALKAVILGLKWRFCPKITATAHRTLTLKETRQVALHLSGEVFNQPLVPLSYLSVFLPPFFPLHAPSWQYYTSVDPPTFHDYPIDVTQVSWPDSEGTLIKLGDRLLAISFVYPAEQTSAEVVSRMQSDDQCQIQSGSLFLSSRINHRWSPATHPSELVW